MSGTRNKKQARSYEAYGVDFDLAHANSVLTPGFFSPAADDTQTAIEEVGAKVAPALDPWDENDSGSISAELLNDWATKRFFHVQQRSYPIYQTGAIGYGGGSYYRGGRWNFRKFTTVLTPEILQPELGQPTYPQLIPGSINGIPPGSNTANTNIPRTAAHYDYGYIILPGPAIWKMKARVHARGNRAQLRIDIGEVSVINTYQRGCVWTDDAANENGALITVFKPMTGIDGNPAADIASVCSVNNGSHIIAVTLSTPLSQIPVIGQPILCTAASAAGLGGNNDTIVYVTSVTDASHFSVEGPDAATSTTSVSDMKFVEIAKHNLQPGNFIECVTDIPTNTGPTYLISKTVDGLGRCLSEVESVPSDWSYTFRMNTANGPPASWTSALNFPGKPTHSLNKLLDAAYIRSLPDQVFFGSSADPAESVVGVSEIECIANLPDATNNVYLWQYTNGNPSSDEDMGMNVPSGGWNVHADLICERIG